jgi:hypothetical protein
MGLRTKLENTMVYIYDAAILHNLAHSLNDTRTRMTPSSPNPERVTKTEMEMNRTSSTRDSLSAPLPHASQ